MDIQSEITELIPAGNFQAPVTSGNDQFNIQLIERVYTPLLNEATSWLDPNGASFGAWEGLRKSVPHLIQLVPPPITHIFDEAEKVFRRLATLTLLLNDLYIKANAVACKKLGIVTSRPDTQAMFRIMSGNAPIEHVYLGRLWVSGKTLKQFSEDTVQQRYPGIDWELELWIDNAKLGDHNMTLRFAGAAESFLYQNENAVELHKKYRELKDLGIKARDEINAELSKVVHPTKYPLLESQS